MDECGVVKVFGVVLLLLSLLLLAEADIDDIELHVTPVQYVSRGDTVQLKCGINVTTTVSKVLPDDLRITWYDGFIPIPAMGNVHETNGYQLRQTIVNISVTGWLQFGRYVCKMEDNNGTVTTKSTAVIPEGMREEDIISDVTSEHPDNVTVSCPVASLLSHVHWDKLSLDLSVQSSYQGVNFPYNLFTYDQSAKFVCYSERLHSIIYVHPKDYDPVRFIYPKENTTLVFDNLDSKLIECRITGSVKPNMSWVHGNVSSPNDIVKRIYTASSTIGKSTHILQLVMNSLIPFLDTGEYVCVVENEWEVVNRSVTILFELLKGNPFHITTFAPVQYMFEGVDFTSRCFIQVDKTRPSHSKITTNVIFYQTSCNNATSTYPTLLQSDDSKIELVNNERYDDYGDIWVIVKLTVFNTTVDDSGCYQCLGASFDHTNNSLANVFFIETPFNITSYEPETYMVVQGSNVTLLCEITVDEDYDIDLVSVYYRYYVDHKVDQYVKFNADINIDTVNRTITAQLNITEVDVQHVGFYECYARSLPADLYIDPDDPYYEVGQNTSLEFSDKIGSESPKSTAVSRHVTIIVTVLSIVSAITVVFIVLLLIYIIRKRTLVYRNKTGLPQLMDNESLFPVSLDLPNEQKSTRQPSLLMREIVTSGWYFPHSDLKFEGTLGSGEFGIVMSALATNIEPDKPVSKVAVKILPGLGDEEAEEDLRKELAALSLVGTYKHIVGMMGASYTEGKLEIIVEFCAKGSLLHHLRAKRNAKEKDFHAVDVLDYAHQIALGMEYLAEKKCVHCDLAARNILITEDNVLKVSDFGLARKLYDQIYKKAKTSRTRLPVRWMAIESIRDLSFTSESDVWAFGIVLWEIIQLGSHPYPGIDNRKILSLLKRGYRMPQPPECPEDIYKVMRNCWKTQPTDRPSFSKLVACLQDLKEQYKSLPHGYVNWHGGSSTAVDLQEAQEYSDSSESEEGDEEKLEQHKEFVCPVHGRLSVTGDDAKLLVKEQHSVDSGISNSTENIHKKAEATQSKVQYVNATNQLFKIHDRLRLKSADSGVGDNGVNSPTIPTCSRKQASRVDSGMPDSPCYSKTSPPYTNISDTAFSHFPPLSPTGSNAYSTDPTSTGTTLNRRLSAHPDNRPMFPALGIEESDV